MAARADEPGSKASGTEIAAWLTGNSWQVVIVGWLGMVGFPIWILLTTLLVWKAESASGAHAAAAA